MTLIFSTITRLIDWLVENLSRFRFNEDGYSPAHTEVVSTLESEPSAPRSLSVKSVSNCSVNLAWLPPAQSNGNLLGYKVHYTHPAGFTDTKTLPFYTTPSRDSSSKADGDSDEEVSVTTGARAGDWISYQLTDLQPYTTYHIRVSAFNSKGDGPYSMW